MGDSQVRTTLHTAHTAYMAAISPGYDEVLNEVVVRIRGEGSIGKVDIGALLFWKRLRANTTWAPRLMTLEERNVRAVTKEAVRAVNNLSLSIPDAAAAGRRALSELSGFNNGDALASALLLAAAPERMAVYDKRAQTGLEALGRTLSRARGRYGRYMALVEELWLLAERKGHTWTARDVDVALYCLGGSLARDTDESSDT